MVKIAIIGAGGSGASAAKACLEEGFDIVVFERSDYIGGLWHYHENDVSGIPSVTKATVINSSKEMFAFTDFPPPEDYPNYMHHSKMLRYIEMYGETFNFKNYIKFRHEIVKCEPAPDYNDTGRWTLSIRDLSSGKMFDDTFNAVLVCTGHHVTPLIPSFPDQEKFKGKLMHTHSYKKPNAFEDMNVVVVGIGNSAADAVVELSRIAKNVYLSTRRGSWVMYRMGPFGHPFDSFFIRRYLFFFYKLFPKFSNWMMEQYTTSRFDHNIYRLKPAHPFLSQHALINDSLPDRILSGTVIVKGNIERFTENGVIFEGENGHETKCDCVIFGTGYRIHAPFISQELIPTDNNQVNLYKFTFPAHLRHPKTLCFIGFIQPYGPIFPISDMQSRVFAQIMANKLQLPSKDEMMKDIDGHRQRIENQYYSASRHTIQVDVVPFMDELANMIGVKPNLWNYFISDNKFWRKLVFGPSVPYQYRLKGPHSWSGARDAVLKTNYRIGRAFKTKQKNIQNNSNFYSIIKSIFAFLFITFVSVLVLYK